MIRKITIKIILLVLIVTGLNFIYTKSLYPKDLVEKSKELIDIHNTTATADIYYFGESSNVTYSKTDSANTSISDLTALFYPGLKLVNINKYATHGGIYKHWLNKINLSVHKPSAIIITLNLRSFNASWINSKLETQLQESLVFTRPFPNIINRFLLALQAFDNRTEKQREKEVIEEWKQTELKLPFKTPFKTIKQWDDIMANGGHLKPDGKWDIEKIELACHYIKGYAFNLDETNPRVRDFDAVANWCSKNKITLYMNLMAENVQYADSLVGKELLFLMRQNSDYLVNRYNKNNCTVINNLERVKGSEFVDQNWTSEHYNIKGRMRIARQLAGALKKQFKTEYKEAY